ncbi:MAG: YlmC/YmxH family sporulation protein [Anaerotruncus sp.]|nr:YlmC/YmxH family sporulation protein [Anaerotruncus sp.]
MFCRVSELRRKMVINVRNGSRLGCVWDLELDTAAAMVHAIIIRGKRRLLGLLGREEDLVIAWSDIAVIGEDTILVNCELPPYQPQQKHYGLFRILTEEDD